MLGSLAKLRQGLRGGGLGWSEEHREAARKMAPGGAKEFIVGVAKQIAAARSAFPDQEPAWPEGRGPATISVVGAAEEIGEDPRIEVALLIAEGPGATIPEARVVRGDSSWRAVAASRVESGEGEPAVWTQLRTRSGVFTIRARPPAERTVQFFGGSAPPPMDLEGASLVLYLSEREEVVQRYEAFLSGRGSLRMAAFPDATYGPLLNIIMNLPYRDLIVPEPAPAWEASASDAARDAPVRKSPGRMLLSLLALAAAAALVVGFVALASRRRGGRPRRRR